MERDLEMEEGEERRGKGNEKRNLRTGVAVHICNSTI